jgi:sodium transport system permease protein
MRATLTVFVKEFLENLRDRRTVMTALLFGPLFGPLFFAAMLQFSLDRSRGNADEVLELRVINAAGAPNFLAFLEAHNVRITGLNGDESTARELIADRQARIILLIPKDYGNRLAAGDPAPLRLFADSSHNADGRLLDRMRGLIGQFSQSIVAQRMALRGINPRLLSPIAIHVVDVSTPASRALLVLGMLSFFLILSLLTGGMYLAIDTTVGERERGTLEPLLATPVARESLLFGKFLATCSYMLLSLCITAIALCVTLSRIDLEQFGMSANLGPGTAVTIIAVTLPLIPLLAALMTLVASATRSAREAQAWLGVLQLVPTLPLVFASLLNLTPRLSLMTVPSLSQHFLITGVLRNESLDLLALATSAASSLLLSAALLYFVARIYRRESLLL